MIRIGINEVYEMNDYTTFTEDDFKNSSERNKKLMSELEHLKELEDLLNIPKKTKPIVKNVTPKEIQKNPFYSLYFRSENPPNIYKLSGNLSTFDKQDVDFNSALPERILSDYLENQKKKYIDELSNKDLIMKPFIEKPSKDELVGKIEDELLHSDEDIPKPPSKWKEYVDKDGDTYYYNVLTKVTQWERPEYFNTS
jgi:hypothetical protein